MPQRPTAPPPTLPEREGPRPRTTTRNPHAQIDQAADAEAVELAFEACRALPGVQVAPSRRAPPGTRGLFLEPGVASGGEQAFLLGREFAHFHPLPEGSLHLTLPSPLREEAIARLWCEPHPLAGQPTVSPRTVMLYAPRTVAEAAVVARLVRASWAFARGDVP